MGSGIASTWGLSWGTSWGVSWDRVFVPPVPSTLRPAGGVAGQRKRRTIVEIDGETFTVRNASEAQALLNAAKEQAQAVAERVAKKALNKARDAEKKSGTLPVLEVAVPEIKVRDASDEIAAMVVEAQKGVDEIYLRAAQAVELAYLARRAYFEQDEDDAISILLL